MKLPFWKRPAVTTRQKALRRCALLLVLAAVVSATNLYGFFPRKALHLEEDRRSMARTEVLRRDYMPQVHGSTLFYVSANDDALMVTSVRYNLFGGWYPVFGAITDFTDEPIHAASYQIGYSNDKIPEKIIYAFGYVNDPAIQSVLVNAFLCSGDEETLAASERVEDFFEVDGRRCFACPLVLTAEDRSYIELRLMTEGEDHIALEQLEITERNGTSMG